MLTGKELGVAIAVAIDRKLAMGKARSKAEIARHFGIRPPSLHDWIKKGSISKDKLPELWRYFGDVVDMQHWGLSANEFASLLHTQTSPGVSMPVPGLTGVVVEASEPQTLTTLLDALSARIAQADPSVRDAISRLVPRYIDSPETGARIVRAIEELLGKNSYITSGDRIRQRRTEMRLTQADLAQRVSVSRVAVSQWENGDTKSLKQEHLVAVARVLGVTVAWIVHGDADGDAAHGPTASVERASLSRTDAASGILVPGPSLSPGLSVRSEVLSDGAVTPLGDLALVVARRYEHAPHDVKSAVDDLLDLPPDQAVALAAVLKKITELKHGKG